MQQSITHFKSLSKAAVLLQESASPRSSTDYKYITADTSRMWENTNRMRPSLKMLCCLLQNVGNAGFDYW